MSAPRLALVGMGRMGREIQRLAQERGWPIVATIDSGANSDGGGITADTLHGAEVAIEFTAPSAAVANVRACLRAGCPVVVGTTGWLDALPDLHAEVERSGGAMLHAANFSIGVNVLWELAARAAMLMRRAEGFQAHILEVHHAAKKDAPSGTAIALQRIASAGWGGEIPVTSVRTGSVPGTHELLFDGAFEQLRLEHVARDRRVFAEGALLAGRWLVGRRGVFTMRDVFAETLGTAGGTA